MHRREPEAQERADLRSIVALAQSGDLDAQSDLVRRYTVRLSAFVRRMIFPSSAVDDVVQMALIKMIRQLGRLRDPATFESWLFTLARNTSLDFLRRQRCRPTSVADDFDFAKIADTDSTGRLNEIEDALDHALARLSPKDRNIVRLIVQGFTYKAAARHEHLSIGAVKLRLNRVRPFLRVAVGEAIGLRSKPSEKLCLPPHSRLAA